MKAGSGSVKERLSISSALPQGFATVDLGYSDTFTVPVVRTSSS